MLSLSLCACPSPPELSWEGEHVRLGAEAPDEICGGTREYLDRRAGELKARFGTTHTIDYYWVPSGVEPFCPDVPAVVGCAPGAEVFSEWVPHEHELVHAADTDMPRALEEGLAAYWGDPWPFFSMAPRERLYPLLLQEDEVAEWEDYGRLAHFMAFLSETYGSERLVDLDRGLDADSGVEDVNRVFLDVFGVSLDGAVMEYDSYPDCTGIVDVSLSCTKEAVPMGLSNPELIRDVDCASSETMGPYRGTAFVEEVIELEPSIDGSRIVRALGDGVAKGGGVVIRRCGPCSENGVHLLLSTAITFVAEEDLPAGRYLVRMYVPTNEAPASIGLRING